MLAVDNRVIMISGASRGLGLALGQTLQAAGYRLSLGVRNPAAAEFRNGGWDESRVMAYPFDAREAASPRAWMEATVARFGQIDGVVNNAAIDTFVGIETGPEVSEDDQERNFDDLWTVNVKAPLRLIRAALPHLKRSGHGRIVNVASLSGKRIPSLAIGYPMTKFALVALTKGLQDLGQDCGIRSTVLCPGFIRTKMSADRAVAVGMKPENMTTPEELSETIDFLLRLPNSTPIEELLINNRFEDTL
jgi:NAD(P)-dependent dehydrogenase (short-subunit alcohol dehydrogenase family)